MISIFFFSSYYYNSIILSDIKNYSSIAKFILSVSDSLNCGSNNLFALQFEKTTSLLKFTIIMDSGI